MIKFYHGTSSTLKPGDLVLPPAVTKILSEIGRKRNLDKVFFTPAIGSAWIYAGRSRNARGGVAAVYEVLPLGKIRRIHNRPGTSVLFARAARVLRRVR